MVLMVFPWDENFPTSTVSWKCWCNVYVSEQYYISLHFASKGPPHDSKKAIWGILELLYQLQIGLHWHKEYSWIEILVASRYAPFV